MTSNHHIRSKSRRKSWQATDWQFRDHDSGPGCDISGDRFRYISLLRIFGTVAKNIILLKLGSPSQLEVIKQNASSGHPRIWPMMPMLLGSTGGSPLQPVRSIGGRSVTSAWYCQFMLIHSLNVAKTRCLKLIEVGRGINTTYNDSLSLSLYIYIYIWSYVCRVYLWHMRSFYMMYHIV